MCYKEKKKNNRITNQVDLNKSHPATGVPQVKTDSATERRSADLSREEAAFKKRLRRRQQDRQNQAAYFALLVPLVLIFFGWLVLAAIYNGVLGGGGL